MVVARPRIPAGEARPDIGDALHMFEDGFHAPEAAAGQHGHRSSAPRRFDQPGRRDRCRRFGIVPHVDQRGQRHRCEAGRKSKAETGFRRHSWSIPSYRDCIQPPFVERMVRPSERRLAWRSKQGGTMMRIHRRLLAAAMLAASASAFAGPVEDFQKLQDDYWAAVLKYNPLFASQVGVKDYDRELGEISIAEFDRQAAEAAAFLARLEAIPAASLSPADRAGHAILKRQLADQVESGDRK